MSKWRVVSCARTVGTLKTTQILQTRDLGGIIQGRVCVTPDPQGWILARMPPSLFKLHADNLRSHHEQGLDYDEKDAARVMDSIRGKKVKIRITQRALDDMIAYDAIIMEVL